MRSSFPLALGILLLRSAQAAPVPTETVALTSAPPHSATGDLFILKADAGAPGLRNPVLVVEGFDIGNSMGWPELYDLLNQENLVADLQAFGRDLAVLNFGDSTADILDNATLNETAIAYVNAHRADPADKFTAIGASLGGLTLRKALVDMPGHGVDTFISFDAPHEGANIPLGIQEYLEFFAPHNDAATNMLFALDRPAARQLLLVHHSHPDGLAGGSAPERADFTAAMAAAGYPTTCTTIAIANGSGLGVRLPFNAGDRIIHWTDSGFLKPSIQANVHALPAAPATVFSGSITFLLPIASATVAAYHPLTFDNAPGGTRSTFYELFTNIPPDQLSADDYVTTTNHCFVPTVSALGIPIGNLAANLAGNAGLLALSPFDELHFATNNEPHVSINPRSKRWLVRAVLEHQDTDGDGLDDYQESLLGTDHASAASTLRIELSIVPEPEGGLAWLSWDAYPNTRYDVWYTAGLDAPWSLVETLPPAAAAAFTNAYELPAGGLAGFFAVTGTPVDPVVD